MFALAHCLLPKSPNEDFELGGRYIDQAISSMIKMMSISPGDYKRVRAIVAGGGNMTRPEGTVESKLVGSLNSKMAIETLRELRIKIIHEDIGGICGRKISLNCFDGTFEVKHIPRPEAA